MYSLYTVKQIDDVWFEHINLFWFFFAMIRVRVRYSDVIFQVEVKGCRMCNVFKIPQKDRKTQRCVCLSVFAETYYSIAA